MKKKVLCVILALLLLTACSSNKMVETKMTGNLTQGISSEITFFAEEGSDIAQKQTAKNIVDYKAANLTKEEVESILNPMKEQYENLEGVTYSLDIQDDKTIEILEVDFDKLDFEKAKDIPGFLFDDTNSRKVSLEKTIEKLEEYGFKKAE